MRRPLGRGIAAVCLLACVAALAAPAPASASLDRATAACVAVTKGAGRIGSAVVVAPGYVLTAAHVADGAQGGTARVLVKESLEPFTVVGIDRERDLALLALDTHSITPIGWGRSEALDRGEDVIALGFPIGMRSVSLTKGVVSSPLQEYDGMRYVQTDAAINPGNSGGPLVDAEGELVGVNVGKVADVTVDSVGFAVPAEEALAFFRRTAPEARPSVSPGSWARQAVPEWAAWVLATLAGAVLAFAAFAVAVRRGATSAVASSVPGALSAEAGATPGRESGAPVPGTPERHPRQPFLVRTASGEERRDVRMPAVLGSARNADLRVRDDALPAYAIRFTVAEDGLVHAADLTGADGMYCGDACVLEMRLRPGESVRVGTTTVTVLERTVGD